MAVCNFFVKICITLWCSSWMISFLFHQLVQQNFTRSSLTNAQNQHRVCNNWAPAIETNSYIFAHREVAAVAEIGSGSRQSLATATTATENESQLCSTHRGDRDKQLPSFHIIASAIRGDESPLPSGYPRARQSKWRRWRKTASGRSLPDGMWRGNLG
jgi:hypothetical protein